MRNDKNTPRFKGGIVVKTIITNHPLLKCLENFVSTVSAKWM